MLSLRGPLRGPGSAVVAALATLVFGACGFPDFAGFDGAGGAGAGSGPGGNQGQGGQGAAGGAGGAGGSAGCMSNAQCAGTPGTPLCNVDTAICVQCLPGPADVCPSAPTASYCTASFQCAAGCKTTTECNEGPEPDVFTCDPIDHRCTGCTQDDDCAAGKLCDLTSTECVPGCTTPHPCVAGFDCCSGQCFILALDENHCGTCDITCAPNPPNAVPNCNVGQCDVLCDASKGDCNDDPADGCEVDHKTDPNDCGICGTVCSAPTPTCVDGTCT